MKLSVIVPIYNVEQYLKNCLDSLVSQTLTDIEFILVDDGSKDKCGDIADEYAEKDCRFKVFHKSNGGLISAWKFGLEHASGDYIGFVDSDDYVASNMFFTLMENAEKFGADIVCCNYFSDENGSLQEVKLSAHAGFYDRKSIVKDILPFAIDTGDIKGYQRCISSVRWNKLFKKQVLDTNMQYYDERISFGEDLLVTYSALACAQSLVVVDAALYYFRYNPQSITHSYNKNLKVQAELCDNILLQITNDYALNCYEQIYRNSAHTVFRVIANELNNINSTQSQKEQTIKMLVNSENVQRGVKSISLKNSTLKEKIKFYLLKHKKCKLIIKYYKSRK